MIRARDDGSAGDLPFEDIPWAEFALPLVAAEDALARLDERLRTSVIRDGFVSRAHYADACASLWLEGELVPVEDLVLHDASADIRAPIPQLARARAVLQTRRTIAARPPDWALPGDPGDSRASASDAALEDALSHLDTALARAGRILSGESSPAKAPAIAGDMADDNGAAAEWAGGGDWRQATAAVSHLPSLLAAGLLWDRWETAPPVPSRAWLGRLMVGAYLRERGKAAAHLPAISAALRMVPWERRRARLRDVRLRAWLDAVCAGAQAALVEHDRLSLAISLLERKCGQRRATSRLPDLVAFAAAHPLITAATVAKALGVTRRAARNLIAELDLHEATGRGRYRAWML